MAQYKPTHANKMLVIEIGDLVLGPNKGKTYIESGIPWIPVQFSGTLAGGGNQMPDRSWVGVEFVVRDGEQVLQTRGHYNALKGLDGRCLIPDDPDGLNRQKLMDMKPQKLKRMKNIRNPKKIGTIKVEEEYIMPPMYTIIEDGDTKADPLSVDYLMGLIEMAQRQLAVKQAQETEEAESKKPARQDEGSPSTPSETVVPGAEVHASAPVHKSIERPQRPGDELEPEIGGRRGPGRPRQS